jgi:hypothetical protein
LLVATGFVELLGRNFSVADTGKIVAGTGVTHVGIDPPEGEWQGNQGKKKLNNSLVIAYCIKHGMYSLIASARVNSKSKKGELSFTFFTIGGVRTVPKTTKT